MSTEEGSSPATKIIDLSLYHATLTVRKPRRGVEPCQGLIRSFHRGSLLGVVKSGRSRSKEEIYFARCETGDCVARANRAGAAREIRIAFAPAAEEIRNTRVTTEEGGNWFDRKYGS